MILNINAMLIFGSYSSAHPNSFQPYVIWLPDGILQNAWVASIQKVLKENPQKNIHAYTVH